MGAFHFSLQKSIKEHDELIVKNSVRYRWIEVRRSMRRLLDCPALARSLDN